VEGSPRVPAEFWDYVAAESIPVLGICYGMQLIVQVRLCAVSRRVVSQCVVSC
jgi:GMP synthase-like glutamine amidotransferase